MDNFFNERNYNVKIYAYYNQDFVGYSCMPELHTHKYFEVMYVESGKSLVTVSENGRQKTILMGKGEYIFIAPDVGHKLFIEENQKCKMYNIEFSVVSGDSKSESIVKFDDLFNKCRNLQAALQKNKYCKMKDVLGLGSVIVKIQKEFENCQKEKTAAANNMLELLIGEFFLLLNRAAATFIPGNIHLNKAIKYIENNLYSDLKIETIAAELGINKIYLQNLFRKNMQKSIHKYITEVRLEKAVELMRAKDLPLIDIAVEVGFNSRQSFFNAFKQIKGVSPKVFLKGLSESRFLDEKYLQKT